MHVTRSGITWIKVHTPQYFTETKVRYGNLILDTGKTNYTLHIDNESTVGISTS